MSMITIDQSLVEALRGGTIENIEDSYLDPGIYSKDSERGLSFFSMPQKTFNALSMSLRKISRLLLGIFFIAAGIGHFVAPQFYLRMMPSFLPEPLLLVYLSGIIEAVLGWLCFVPRHRSIARWGIVALLVAVFPANLHMAMHSELFPEFSAMGLWIRLPIQLIFVLWVFYALQTPFTQTTHSKS